MPQAAKSSSERQQVFQDQFRKTVICRFFLADACKKGSKCTFAHTVEELQEVPDLRNTALCKLWKRGMCTLSADRCPFAHSKRELRLSTAFAQMATRKRSGLAAAAAPPSDVSTPSTRSPEASEGSQSSDSAPGSPRRGGEASPIATAPLGKMPSPPGLVIESMVPPPPEPPAPEAQRPWRRPAPAAREPELQPAFVQVPPPGLQVPPAALPAPPVGLQAPPPAGPPAPERPRPQRRPPAAAAQELELQPAFVLVPSLQTYPRTQPALDGLMGASELLLLSAAKSGTLPRPAFVPLPAAAATAAAAPLLAAPPPPAPGLPPPEPLATAECMQQLPTSPHAAMMSMGCVDVARQAVELRAIASEAERKAAAFAQEAVVLKMRAATAERELMLAALAQEDFVAFCLFAPDLQAQQELGLPAEPQLDGGRSTDARLLPPEPTTGTLVLRGLMLTRLTRIVRILRLHGPLYAYVRLLLRMMNTYLWILSIIFILCFVMAIVLTSLVAHGLLGLSGDSDSEALEQVMEYFADIPKSLFTLFQLTTAEDWSRIQNSVIAVAPVLRGFFICFIVFMSWTMLSLLTAVASETMISASTTKKEQDAMDQEIQRHSFSSFLCAEFVKADTDGNRVLDKEEFEHLMTQPQMKQTMKAHGIHLQDTDLMKTWDTFDIDESGELTIDELVTGFSYMQENLAMKHVANVCYSLKHFGIKMETNTDILHNGADELSRRQTHSAKMVQNDVNWQMKRWQLFRAGDMEELTTDTPCNSEAGHSDKNSESRNKTSWSMRSISMSKRIRDGTKERMSNTLMVPGLTRLSRSSSSIRTPPL